MPTHAETKLLPYTPAQMFALVADIEAYPEFLPWCLACHIVDKRGRRPNVTLIADLTIGYKIFRETFTSEVALNPKTSTIDVTYIRGPFRYLNNHWAFRTAPNHSCMVEFNIDFEFRTGLLQKIMGVFFNEAVRRMIAAFEARAQQLYG